MRSVGSKLIVVIHLTMYHISTEKILSHGHGNGSRHNLDDLADDQQGTTPAPRYMQLGNQTVDLSRAFKVPQLEGRGHHGTRPDQDKMPWLRPRTQYEHDRRHGPHFEDMDTVDNSSMTVQAGHTAHLDCRVSFLRDKTVSWLRRRPGEAPTLLTVGAQTYTGDARYTVQFRYPGNWRLQVTSVNKSDEGLYECQLSTHPPIVIRVNLWINAPEVAIVDEAGKPLREKYYEADSTLMLRCVVRGESKQHNGGEAPIWWLHGSKPLHRDTRRGGVGVRTERLPGGGGTDSTLKLSKLAPADAGNYTCALPHRTAYTVLVHVLNEESLAELQQGSSTCGPPTFLGLLLAVLFALLACS